jgi:hypothetical protein
VKNVLARMILGPVVPDWGGDEVSLTVQSQAMKLKGSLSGEPSEADKPITENPTNDPQPS